jgi:hypothetical protein
MKETEVIRQDYEDRRFARRFKNTVKSIQYFYFVDENQKRCSNMFKRIIMESECLDSEGLTVQ